jgi:leucyl/phenylalanyl-tRNA--protein transferase
LNKIIKSKELIKLYKKGYFPMAEDAFSSEISFYKPEKRFIIPINSFHIPKKLFNEFKKNKYQFLINSNFSEVIKNCARKRKTSNETWINQTIIDTFIQLNHEGHAKSIECYLKNELVGGLYGLHIGGCFFGESMFSSASNVSKLCLLFLVSILIKESFNLLDSQFYNPHLLQFGAYEISNFEYQEKLKNEINKRNVFLENYNHQESISILHSISHKS